MENKIRIKLDSIEEVKEFVHKTIKFNDDIMLFHGREIIDGKSIDDIIEFGLGKIMEVELFSYSRDAEYEFETLMKQFVKKVD